MILRLYSPRGRVLRQDLAAERDRTDLKAQHAGGGPSTSRPNWSTLLRGGQHERRSTEHHAGSAERRAMPGADPTTGLGAPRLGSRRSGHGRGASSGSWWRRRSSSRPWVRSARSCCRSSSPPCSRSSSSRWSGSLDRRGLKPTLAAGLIVLGLLAPDDRRRGRDRPGCDRPDRRDRCVGRRGDRQRGRARDRRGRARGRPGGQRGDRSRGRRGLPHQARLGTQRLGRPGRRPDPRRADHVLPAQGRQPAQAVGRRADRPPRPRTRSTTSSATRAGSSATTDGAAR